MHIYVTITIATIIATTIAITIATLICIAIIKYQIVCNNTEKDFIANIGLVIVVADGYRYVYSYQVISITSQISGKNLPKFKKNLKLVRYL